MFNIMSETNDDGNYQTMFVYTGKIVMALTMQLYVSGETNNCDLINITD